MDMTEIETGTDDLLGRIEGHVAVLSFNRPQRRNALSDAMYDGFGRALPVIERDPSVRVLLVTGEGGAFCAGGDVKGMHERNAASGAGAGGSQSLEDRVAWLRSRQALVSLALRRLPKPVVAALPGAAAGAGLSMALAADLRVAAERAVLVTAFANVGASGDFGTSWFLPRLVGEARAKELMFLSPRLTAAEAADLGLVNRVLDDEGFAQAALAFCHDLAARAPIALRYMKENVNRALEATLHEALDAEATAMVRTMGTADHREAAAAFVEKRSPEFSGN
jgi:2-(1,2-epoxy-1,2-dihydrophenyl)acetyl-CoA isomerase